MNDERDLKLGDIDQLDVDEPVPPRRSAENKSPAQSPANTGKREIVSPSGGIWAASTAFLLVLVVVLGAWFFQQLNRLQGIVDNRLSESTEQLGSLASQLSATDESVSQSSDQVKQTLATHDSEIRKLWDVSNKRNRGWIEKNQADIARMERQRAELTKTVESLKTEVAQAKLQAAQWQAARNQMQLQMELTAEKVGQLESRLASQHKQLETLNGLLPAIQSMARLDSAGGGLAGRMSEIEAAIEAFDAYRRQVNVRLDGLDGGGR